MDRLEQVKEAADRLERERFAARCRELEQVYAGRDYRAMAVQAFTGLMDMAAEQDKETAWLGIFPLHVGLATGSHEVLLALYGEEFYFDPLPLCRYWRPPVFDLYFEEDMEQIMKELRRHFPRIWRYEEDAVRRLCVEYYHAALWRLCAGLEEEILETESFRRMKRAQHFTAFFGRFRGEGEILWQLENV